MKIPPGRFRVVANPGNKDKVVWVHLGTKLSRLPAGESITAVGITEVTVNDGAKFTIEPV